MLRLAGTRVPIRFRVSVNRKLYNRAVAAMPDPSGKHYYFEIMLPGGIVGIIVGYATQRFGVPQPASQ